MLPGLQEGKVAGEISAIYDIVNTKFMTRPSSKYGSERFNLMYRLKKKALKKKEMNYLKRFKNKWE